MESKNIKDAPPYGPNARRMPPIWTAIIIAAITFTVYLPALQNYFVKAWDDADYVYDNKNIRAIDSNFLKWDLTAVVMANWHPLTMFSHALDYAVWGLNPWGHHLTNILFHTANTFLVFVLAARLIECGLTQNSRLETRNFSLIAASVTALLFGLHPLHVESVAWISERKDVLSAFFFLSSIIAYLNYVRSKNLMPYVLSLVSFILALLGKPMAVSLPIVLLLLDFYPLNRLGTELRSGTAKVVLLEKMPFYVMSFIFSLIAIWTQHSSKAMASLEQIPLVMHLFTAPYSYIFYLSKMLFPFNLSPLYPYPRLMTILSFKYMAPIVLLPAITFICVKEAKRTRLFLGIWLYYILTLLPVIGVVQIGKQMAADRYAYLPSVGPFLLFGIAMEHLFKRRPGRPYLIPIILMLLSLMLIFNTIKQIGIWHDSMSFWLAL